MTLSEKYIPLNKEDFLLLSKKQGIVAPAWLQEMMVSTAGQREAEASLQLGNLVVKMSIKKE